MRIEGLRSRLAAGEPLIVTNTRSGARIGVRCPLTPRERDILLAGGLLAHTRGASLTSPAAPSPLSSPPQGERAG